MTTISRRAFIGGVATAAIGASAGCLTSERASVEVVSEAEHLTLNGVYFVPGFFGDDLRLESTVNGPDGVSALVWIGSGGEQVGATSVPYGGGQEEIEADVRTDKIFGSNRLVAVKGGETDCFGRFCGHSGGQEAERIEFEVTQ